VTQAGTCHARGETPTLLPTEAKLRQVAEIKTCTGTTIGSTVV
jgi:hypothetical protein